MGFLDFAVAKGYMKTATGQAMKTACKEVFSATEGDAWEMLDLDAVSVEDTLQRFSTLRAMKFSTGSLNTYKTRFRKAVAMFKDFRDDPPGWRPDMKQRSRTAKPASNGAPSDAGVARKLPAATPGNITYPFPLRDGVLASLQLPSDLSKREAQRLGAFINSLAMEEQPALGTGDPASA